jgi:Na+/H+-dicarboxylate symporter
MGALRVVQRTHFFSSFGRVSLTTRVLLALVAGIALGLALSAMHWSHAATLIAVIEPVGTLFVNAVRMTVIPLVFSLLVAGVASAADPVAIGRLGGRALLVFIVLLTLAGVTAALVAPPVLARVPIDPQAVASLRATIGDSSGALVEGARRTPTFAQWLTDLVPANPIRAAADGAMLPLIVFAVALGLALLAIPVQRRTALVELFRGFADAMLVIVRWILKFAPIGVFALSLPLVAKLGFTAVSALASYVVLVSLATFLFVLVVIYPIAAIGGHLPVGQFARAVLPAQAVAFTSRSSLAALPALIEGARTRLAMREEVTSFLLPLASATFRIGASLGLTVGALFIARLYGEALSPAGIATIVMTSVITSFSIPGVPAGSIIGMVPVLSSVNLPLSGLGILLGVDTIPDSFRTAGNVTAQMAAVVVVARERRARIPRGAAVSAAVSPVRPVSAHVDEATTVE